MAGYDWTYDVFISFRGADTRKGFTEHLHSALNRRGFLAFMDDDELQRGEQITAALEKAIEHSRVAIVVFSKGYASSAYCLDELAKICEGSDFEKGKLVLPIFYKVDPSDVRYQRGSYGEAFSRHEKRFNDNKEKVHRWRTALYQAADLSGFTFKQEDGYEYQFIGRIIKHVSSKINRTPLLVANYPVGLESRVGKVISLLDVGSDDVVLRVGIWGMGGIGKTTLARAVYNSIANHFEGSLCYLQNVRETSNKHGLVYLQEKLLSEIVGAKDINLGNVKNGMSIIEQRLHRKKVLLVLDDVDKIEQLQAMVGATDWFGSGSRLIITTRDRRLLKIHCIERTYEVEGLNQKEALQLFSWNAFRTDEVDPDYVDILNRAVSCASGLPLALEVIGSSFYGKQPIEEWKFALERYKRIPRNEIQKILKVSFDSLDEDEKTILLDIACCFGGYKLTDVEDILSAHHGGLDIKFSIGLLIEKSLVKVDDAGLVTLHDLVQDMGKEIVRQESPEEPGKRSRLWYFNDVLQVLEGNTGTSMIEIIILDFPKHGVHSKGPKCEEVKWDGEAIKKMKNIRTLIIRNGRFSKGPTHLPDSLRVLTWRGYPSPSLPHDFCPKKLRILELHDSCLKPSESIQRFIRLTVLDFGYAECLTHIPDVSGVPNLEKLSIRNCENLSKIHESVGYLDKLRILDAVGCKKLKSFPPIRLISLVQLHLSHCSILESFPKILGKMENITELHITSSPIKELPFSIPNLTRLRELELQLCGKVRLPSGILKLSELGLMHVSRCEELLLSELDNGEEMLSNSSNTEHVILSRCNISNGLLPRCLTWFNNVKDLNLSGNSFTILPECIKQCCCLRYLKLDDCRLLKEIRGIPYKLESLSAKGCISLKALDLTVLPAVAEEFHYMRDLYLDGCESLTEIRGVRRNLDNFSAKNCTCLTSLSASMLLNQESIEAGYKMFCLPGTKIPEWFMHCTWGEPISFWFRSKLPTLSFCLVIGPINEQPITVKFSPSVLINRNKQSLASWKVYEFRVETDHICLFDLQMLKFDDNVNILLEKEWNLVEVSYADHITDGEVPIKLVAKQSGIHVIKQTCSMEDIQFTNPNYKKRKTNLLLTSESKNCLLLKEKHGLVDMVVSETQFMQEQQHLALWNLHGEHSRDWLSSLPAEAMQNLNWDPNSMEGPHQRVKATETPPQEAQTMVPSSPLLKSSQPPPAEAKKGKAFRPKPSVERSCEDVGGETIEWLLENVYRTTGQNDPPVKGGGGGDDVELDAVYVSKHESEESSCNGEGSDSDDSFDWVNAKLSFSRKQTTSSGESSGDVSLTSIRNAINALEPFMVKDLHEISSDRAMQSQLVRLLDLLSTISHPKVTIELKDALVEFKRKASASCEEFQATIEPVNKLKNFEKQRDRILQEAREGKDRWKEIKNSIKKASLSIKAENRRKKVLEAEIATLRKQLATKESNLEQLVLNVTNQEATLSTYLTTCASLDEQARELLKDVDDLVTSNIGVD